jgi:hypothetical protein
MPPDPNCVSAKKGIKPAVRANIAPEDVDSSLEQRFLMAPSAERTPLKDSKST